MNSTGASYDELREVLALVRAIDAGDTEAWALLSCPDDIDSETKKLLKAAIVLLRTLASDQRLSGCGNEIDRLTHLVIEYEATHGGEAR